MGEGLIGYCIRRAGEPAPSPDLKGVDAAAVRLLEEAGLGIWLSRGPAAAVPTLERMREHDGVVRAALRTATPLPVRFGTWFASEEEARRSLRERRDPLAASLDRVAGRVEMGIRLLWDPGPIAPAKGEPPEPRSGREYLELRRRQLEQDAELRRRADALLQSVLAPLAPLELPTQTQLLPAQGVLGVVAHLVHRDQLDQYRARLEQVEAGLRQVELVLSGPWAPYSFV